MRKHFLVIIFGCCLSLFSYSSQQNAEHIGMINFFDFDYEKAWKKVTDFQSKGLLESALKVVNEIYDNAKKEKNTGQLVKAVVHKLLFTNVKEENAVIKNILLVKEEARTAVFPEKPILHSMLAEMYWRYYQNNRYRFANRSATVNTDDNDIETWSLDKIVEETQKEYALSLENAELSKAEKIEQFVPALYQGNETGRKFRPTLYDFLAHRALDFFTSTEPDIAKPAYYFTLDKEVYLAPSKEFANYKITTQDTLSSKFHALLIFQQLENFHANDGDPAALIDATLRRMKFVNAALTLPDKNELYYQSLDQFEKQVTNHPAVGWVTREKGNFLVETASLYQPLQSEDHKWDLKKAYDLCEIGKKRFPDSDGAVLCENLQEDILNKSIAATIEANTSPDLPFRALLHYKNFTELHYRIIKTNREEVRAIRKKVDNQYFKDYSIDKEQKFIENFAAAVPVKSGKFTLPDDGDHQLHSIEVKLDALTVGEYIILFSNTPDFTVSKNGLAYGFTVVSNISYVNRLLKDGSSEFYVLHRESGEPLSRVKAEVFFYEYNSSKGIYVPVKVNSFSSDSKGYFKVPFSKNNYHRNFFVNFTKGEDFNSMESIDNRYSYYDGSINQYKTEEPGERTQTFFFLDRAIYRPGQTIYFKGLVTNTNGKTSKILSSYSTSIVLRDVNREEKATLHVRTNEYGTFSGTFVAPTTGLTGEMRIENNDMSGSVFFSVEEYKRPKFEVGFIPQKGTFRLDDDITAEGFARAYSGANIDGGKVSYRIVREASFPFWWWCRWGFYPSSSAIEIAHGLTETDAEGKFNITFKAIPDKNVDPSSDPRFTYAIYADVTDLNGETHSSTTYIVVGYKALQVSVNTPNINKDADRSKKLTIHTLNLAGEFEPAKGQIKIHALQMPTRAFRTRLWHQPDRQLYSKEEYYQFFPYDLYEDETNKFKWAKGREVYSLNFNTAEQKEFIVENLNQWSSGDYVLEISSRDKYGKDVREVSYFTVYSPSSKSIPGAAIHFFVPMTYEVEPGEKVSFSVGTTEPKIHVLYEIERDGAIISKDWLTLKNEQRLLEIPVKEEYRGDFGVHYTFVKNNRLFAESTTITVPYTNKQLDLTFESFREKLKPGEEEEWKIRVAGKTSDKFIAEMVATLYDESLDEFRNNYWYANLYNFFYARLGWGSATDFNIKAFNPYVRYWNSEHARFVYGPVFDSFNWFGYPFYDYYYGYNRPKMQDEGAARTIDDKNIDQIGIATGALADAAPMEIVTKEEGKKDSDEGFMKTIAGEDARGDAHGGKASAKVDLSEVKVRKNFNETAFFYPHLQTNDKGEIVIKFTVPEALTRWKMLGFAHTKDLKSGYLTNHLVTQKELMVVPNQPRFFRENDAMMFSAKISSLVDKELNGQAQLEFFDALTMAPINAQMKNKNASQPFSLKPKQSTSVEWSIEIPEGVQAITYRIVAKAGKFSDGEEMVLPVVTNRTMITETLPLPIRGKQTKEFVLDKMVNNQSTTLRHQKYTLEFTSNPAWYAIQALPYMMEYPYECVEQTFSRYYANSIASHIANSNPRIKQVFDTWKNIQPDALLSNLEKNQELKSALLEETPWVLQAKDESQRKRAVALLFDLNRMGNEMDRALGKVIKAQTSSGGFTWFPGFPEDQYMTQHIIAGFGHLDVMGVKSIHENGQVQRVISSALSYLDRKIKIDYDHLVNLAKIKKIKLDENHISYIQFHYLYTRSYFKDIPINNESKEAFDYFLSQAKKYWFTRNIYLEGMTCLALYRFGETATTKEMIKSFNERALHSEEMGMYWKNEHGYWWYQAPIETQAMMIEVFDEVAQDVKVVEDLKVWLLKQKQTQDWKTTKATSEACYALLRRGTDQLANTELVDVKIGEETVDPLTRPDTKVEAGTGYFKTSWQAGEIKPSMGKITVTKKDDGVAWGAVYWQYLEQLDKITPAETPLKLKKDLFVQQNTDKGPVITPVNDKASFKIGDLVKVRIELRVDRDMEYIHLKDMRAAGFEPVSTLSTYKYQDGLYYYESPRDLATNFFMGYLPKGTYVFEYDLRVSQKGNFSNGITTIQCMYAPEFSSHSQGIRITAR